MYVQWWSLLGRSRCFHSFIQDLQEDVSFCSSWLDLGEEWGEQIPPGAYRLQDVFLGAHVHIPVHYILPCLKWSEQVP